MISQEETLKLIAKAQGGDEDAKNKLIIEHSPLVKSLIKRYKNKNIDYEDLYQLGCIGFTRAINKFNAEYNVQFSTYAVPIILGEIKRELRDEGYIKVSRTIKHKALLMKKFIEKFLIENSHSPNIEEIANYFDLEVQEVAFILDSIKMPISIYEKLDDGDNSQYLFDKIANEDSTEECQIDKIVINNLINSLPEKERKIMLLRYFQDKTQSEIAQELGVSQVQVSRIETKVLEKLKGKLV